MRAELGRGILEAMSHPKKPHSLETISDDLEAAGFVALDAPAELTDRDWESFLDGHYVPACFPGYMVRSVREYLVRGAPMGGYLTALFSGRVFDAVCNADAGNFRSFAWQARWIAQCAPVPAFGSPANVEAWISEGGLVGRGEG